MAIKKKPTKLALVKKKPPRERRVPKMTDQHQQHHQQQPQGQAYGTSQAKPAEQKKDTEAKDKKADAKAAKPKPVPMVPGTPPRPMTPNEIIAAGRSYTTEPLPPVDENEEDEEVEPASKEK